MLNFNLYVFFEKTFCLLFKLVKFFFNFPGFFFNNRGIYFPKPLFQDDFTWVLVSLGAAVLGAVLLSKWAARRLDLTGRTFPSFSLGSMLVIGAPAAVYWVLGRPIVWEYAVLKGFNFQGGLVLRPEFSALMAGLVLRIPVPGRRSAL